MIGPHRESGQQPPALGKAERKARLQKTRAKQVQGGQPVAQVRLTTCATYVCMHMLLTSCASASSGTRESYGGSVTVSGGPGSAGRTGQRQTAGRGRGQSAGKRVRSGAGVG
jgi:hypothetical protein